MSRVQLLKVSEKRSFAADLSIFSGSLATSAAWAAKASGTSMRWFMKTGELGKQEACKKYLCFSSVAEDLDLALDSSLLEVYSL